MTFPPSTFPLANELPVSPQPFPTSSGLMEEPSTGLATTAPHDRTQALSRLTRQIRELETVGRPQGSSVATGCLGMDQALPGGGYAAGSMVELVRDVGGVGTTSLALAIARSAISEGKYLFIVDRERQFYPPVIQSLGIAMDRIIVLQPTSDADAVWGLDQALRCSAVGAAIATMHRLDDRVARRLQLATEQGGGLGILLRDVHSARRQPSWADVQWRVRSGVSRNRPASNRFDASDSSHRHKDTAAEVRWFDLELLRVQGGRAGVRMRVGLDDRGHWVESSQAIRGQNEHAGAVHLAAQLAKSANRRRELAG